MNPKKCPACNSQFLVSDVSLKECPSCGVIFEKWEHHLKSSPPPKINQSKKILENKMIRAVVDHLLTLPPDMETSRFYGRLLLYISLLIWGFRFIFLIPFVGDAMMNSIFHYVNLAFHEAGHVIFGIFGKFIMFLGGSLMQLIMPAVVTGAFIRKQENFGASVGLWWFSQSLMDLAPYINDARDLNLMLLGGGTGKEIEGHDWKNILEMAGLIEYDHTLAWIVGHVGILLMILALVWGGALLYKHYKQLQPVEFPQE